MTVQELTDKLGAYAPQMQVYFREPYDEGDLTYTPTCESGRNW